MEQDRLIVVKNIDSEAGKSRFRASFSFELDGVIDKSDDPMSRNSKEEEVLQD